MRGNGRGLSQQCGEGGGYGWMGSVVGSGWYSRRMLERGGAPVVGG